MSTNEKKRLNSRIAAQEMKNSEMMLKKQHKKLKAPMEGTGKSVDWDYLWKSRGGIMVNGVPREVKRPKPEGPQAPRVLAAGPPEAQHSP